MSEPISLALKRKEPLPDVIEAAERLLADARSGELRCLLFISLSNEAVGSGAAGETRDPEALMGHLLVMLLDLYSDVNSRRGTSP